MKRSAALVFLLFVLASLAMLGGTASAQVVGPCTATIAGVDANNASTPQTAVEVSKDQSIAIMVNGPNKFTGHKVMLEFAGIQWTVNQQTDDGKSWSDSVDAAKYAKYGVGLYKVIGVSSGNPCSGTAYVKVGGSPLATAAGAAAAAATVVGGALVAASAARAAKRPAQKVAPALQFRKMGSAVKKPDSIYPSEREGVEYYLPGREPGFESEEELEEGDPRAGMGCFGMLPTALFQTMALMVAGMGTPGAAAVTSKPKVGFKLMISVSGVIGAFLAGLGTLVLAQQFGVVYPTRTVTIVWLVAAVVIEILMTTLAGRSGIKKALRMLAAAPAEQPTAQPEAEA